LQREVEVWNARRVDRKFLAEIGRFWQETDPCCYEYDGLREPLATAITAPHARAAALGGHRGRSRASARPRWRSSSAPS
jgi:hypothetical protein